MVEFVKGNALMGALVILVGGLFGLIFGIQSYLDSEIWDLFNAPTPGPQVILPTVLSLGFGIIILIGGIIVIMGNNTGNTLAVILGLIFAIFWVFALPLPASVALGYFYYTKAILGPVFYLMGGLFGLSIRKD
ncbi:MAG: hypothetical protein ACFFEE_04435 [Candidatus Thorarchaeota archaeon]